MNMRSTWYSDWIQCMSRVDMVLCYYNIFPISSWSAYFYWYMFSRVDENNYSFWPDIFAVSFGSTTSLTFISRLHGDRILLYQLLHHSIWEILWFTLDFQLWPWFQTHECQPHIGTVDCCSITTHVLEIVKHAWLNVRFFILITFLCLEYDDTQVGANPIL